ncbi:MAG: small subunit ribosomal protein S19e [Candidatus Woesearchaeota archaeon]|nr:small subunit ribosomal protein S19e [Candidatus Woesearchaeota archaeon]MDN5327373.1 small subunit ribosomal protein S19e [Candidatus Woesearchaeota archaeon]
MVTLFDVDPQKLIKATAEKLKTLENIKEPEWAKFVKTGHSKERPPMEKDWWYTRAAAILRKVAIRGPIGVSKLRVLFGSKKNRGFKPEKFYKAAGNHIRKILQQLEKEGLIVQKKEGQHKGRIITPKGKSFLDKIATEIAKSEPKKEKAEKTSAKKTEKKEAAKKKEEKAETKEKKETKKTKKNSSTKTKSESKKE